MMLRGRPKSFKRFPWASSLCRHYRCVIPSTPESRERYDKSSWRSERSQYDNTISNLKIGSHTRVIFQGFTGRQATFDAKQSLEYGTNIVGGVKPGYTGEHLGLPVLPNMRAAMKRLRPDATAVYVAAGQAASAIEEAIEAEIPLVVAVAEHIPLHDMLRIQKILRTQSKTRLVGPNAPGMISPIGKCRIGFPPIPFFSPGSVGIVAKSGTLSYETVASTTRAGLGQSLVIGMGGDILPGTDFVDALNVFEHDEATEGIIMVGEVGGDAEEQAVTWIKQYNQRTRDPKPIMALVAGVEAVPGRVMGHAGAFAAVHERGAKAKIKRLASAGVVMTDHPAKFGLVMKSLLRRGIGTEKQDHLPGWSFGNKKLLRPSHFRQGRSMHTLTKRPRHTSAHPPQLNQQRNIHLTGQASLTILGNCGIPIEQHGVEVQDSITVLIDVYRGRLQPRLRIIDRHHSRLGTVNFEVTDSSDTLTDRLRSRLPGDRGIDDYHPLIRALIQCFLDKEALLMHVILDREAGGSRMSSRIYASMANITFDDAAYRSSGRQKDVHELRDVALEVPEELEAEEDGIVYIKLKGDGNIGTLVNGAGLAMNTVDTLVARGGACANFLDTGGKATRDTVKASFRLILRDARVTAVFVNIFGGLTLCDMIAEGILLAYRDLGIKLPVVVRLRGTNEGVGQKMIADSGLPLLAYDDFEEAAKKVIELAGKG
ncbi:hypothetical protein MMC13_008271 [Lambiella insularis]|nr:hypothetical protein [Lambiella insularis]